MSSPNPQTTPESGENAREETDEGATSKTLPLTTATNTAEEEAVVREEAEDEATSKTPPLRTETVNGGNGEDPAEEAAERGQPQAEGEDEGEAEGEGEAPTSPSHSHSQPSTAQDVNNSSQLTENDDSTIDEQMDFSELLQQSTDHNGPMGLSSHIEIHPSNETLGTSRQKFIKRPLNAYMIWTRQERKRILTCDPKLKMNEVSKAMQMGEKWKAMTDAQKKPYFELARKFALEHKQALQEHPELTYAPSKKKGPKSGSTHAELQKQPPVHHQQQHHQQQSKNHHSGSSQGNPSSSFAATPDPSPRSTTPRQILAPQNPMFFQSPLSSGMQIAQVLGVRPGAQLINNPSAWTQVQGVQATPPATPVSGSLLGGQQHQQTAFVQPQQLQQRLANPLGVQQLTAAGAVQRGVPATPGQMLDLYYTSLCQPAFPTIAESPVNTLSMYPPSYLLEQYNQHFHQQQQQSGSGGGGANNTGGGGGHF